MKRQKEEHTTPQSQPDFTSHLQTICRNNQTIRGDQEIEELIRKLLTKMLAWSLMRKCFLLKLNLRIFAQLKVLIFVFPYNETYGRFQDEWHHKLICKAMQTC